MFRTPYIHHQEDYIVHAVFGMFFHTEITIAVIIVIVIVIILILARKRTV